MKINKSYNHFIAKNIYNTQKDLRVKNRSGNKNNVNVQISKTAKELVNKIKQADDVKMSEKVEKIRQSIIEGSYKVSSEEIAEKILKTIDMQKGKSE